jgi:hypothetical protein
MRHLAIVAACSIAVGGCTPTYTPLSYTTSDIEPTVDCARYVLPADVELLRRAGGWQIGTLGTASATPSVAKTIARNGGTHFYLEGRSMMAVHVPEARMAQLPPPLQPSREKYPHRCTEESYR